MMNCYDMKSPHLNDKERSYSIGVERGSDE